MCEGYSYGGPGDDDSPGGLKPHVSDDLTFTTMTDPDGVMGVATGSLPPGAPGGVDLWVPAFLELPLAEDIINCGNWFNK